MNAGLELGTASSQGGLVPVSFNTELVETDDRIERNIRACLSRRYNSIQKISANPFRPSMSIVGSGPSVQWMWREVKGDILACNAAHDFLLRKKITPRYGMLWDPVEVLNDFITPHDDVTYLMASRCHPNLFRRFEENKVYVWHADGDPMIKRLLEEYKVMEPMVMGGSTAVTRGMFLAVMLGYLDLHVFGIDSSYDASDSHLRKSVVDENQMQIHCGGRWFTTTPWLAVQAEDFKKIAPYLMSVGVKLTVYGDGLIPHIARLLNIPVRDGTTPKEDKCLLVT